MKNEHPVGEEEDEGSGERFRIGPKAVADLDFGVVVAERRRQGEAHHDWKTHPAQIFDQDCRLQGTKVRSQGPDRPVSRESERLIHPDGILIGRLGPEFP